MKKYTKMENKDFALKLLLIQISMLIQQAQDVRSERANSKQILEIIKKYEKN